MIAPRRGVTGWRQLPVFPCWRDVGRSATQNAAPVPAGGRYEFRYTLHGDVWTLERWEGERRGEREVWQRVPR